MTPHARTARTYRLSAIRHIRRMLTSPRDDGIALAIVMFPLLIAALIASNLTLTTRTDLLTTQNAQRGLSRQLAAESVINRTLLRFMGRTDRWPRMDGTLETTSFEEFTVNVSVRSESAKINLNQIPNPALANLFILACVPRTKVDTLVATIADYIDGDDAARLYGLEKSGYAALGLPYGPRNGRFQSIDEIRRVPGMSEDLYEWIRPFTTVYTFNEIPDLNLADSIVKRAVLGPNAGTVGVEQPLPTYPNRTGRVSGVGFVGILNIAAWTVEDHNPTPALEETVYLTGNQRNPLLVLDRRISPSLAPSAQRVCS